MDPPDLPTFNKLDLLSEFTLDPDSELQKEWTSLNAMEEIEIGREIQAKNHEIVKVYSLYKPDVARLIDTRGIPNKLRGRVWLTLLDGHFELEKTVEEYEYIGNDLHLTRENESECEYVKTQAELDWKDPSFQRSKPPTFGKITANDKFYLNGEGVRARARVLSVFAEMNPHITFCPMIPPITTVLLHFMPEAHTYAALVAIFKSPSYMHRGEGTRSSKFLWHGKNAHAQNLFVMEEIAWEYLSPFWFDFVRWQLLWDSELVYVKENLSEESVLLTRFLTNWTDLVLERLPFWCIVRVLDQFFLHGQKILFRACLAVLLSAKSQVREVIGPAFDKAEKILKRSNPSTNTDDIRMLRGEEKNAPSMRAHEISNPPMRMTIKERLKAIKKNLTRRKASGNSPSGRASVPGRPPRSSFGARTSIGGLPGGERGKSPRGSTLMPRRSIDVSVMRATTVQEGYKPGVSAESGHLTVSSDYSPNAEALVGVSVADLRELRAIVVTVEKEVQKWTGETRVHARQLRMMLSFCDAKLIATLCVRFHVTANEIEDIHLMLSDKELEQVKAERRRIYDEEGLALRNTNVRAIPKLAGSASKIMNHQMLSDLWSHAPDTVKLDNLRLAFCTWKHGYNLHMLYNQCADVCPMFLLVKTTASSGGKVFGAYLTEPWINRHKSKGYYGTGESFVFSLSPTSAKYEWSCTEKLRKRKQELIKGIHSFHEDPGAKVSMGHSFFTQANDKYIMIGGGGQDSGHAITLNEDLSAGSTNPNTTYTNPSFTEEGRFSIADVEIWCLASDLGAELQGV
eukprot:CFRG4567T1